MNRMKSYIYLYVLAPSLQQSTKYQKTRTVRNSFAITTHNAFVEQLNFRKQQDVTTTMNFELLETHLVDNLFTNISYTYHFQCFCGTILLYKAARLNQLHANTIIFQSNLKEYVFLRNITLKSLHGAFW